MNRSTNFGGVIAALLAALCVVLVTPAAQAQTVEERIDLLLGDSYADYDMLQLDAAEDKLFEAIDLIDTYDVRTPGAAGTFIMLGVIWAARSGDAWEAYDPFYDGLSIDPWAELHPYYATPSLMEVLEEARLNAPEPAPVAPDPYVPPQPDPYVPPQPDPYVTAQPAPYVPPQPDASQLLMHSRVTEARSNREIPITAQVPVTAPVARVQLNYRPFGEPNFFALDLSPASDGVTFAGEIPANSTRGVISIDYFIVALDRAGNAMGTAGTSAQPYSIFVTGGGDGPDRGNRQPRSRNNNRGNSGGEIAHLSLGAGSGIGLATGDPNVYAEDVDLNPGLAPTPFHIGAELGFAPGRGSFHIVPFLRLQMVFLDTGIEPEPLFGLKLRYFFKDEAPLRVYAQGSVGYGEVSHLVLLREIEDGTYDTTNEGPIHVGGGIGMVYMVSDSVGIQADIHLMAMFSQFSLQGDLTAGLYLGF